MNLIYENLKNKDLTTVPRFLNYLTKIGKTGESLIEAFKCLRVIKNKQTKQTKH